MQWLPIQIGLAFLFYLKHRIQPFCPLWSQIWDKIFLVGVLFCVLDLGSVVDRRSVPTSVIKEDIKDIRRIPIAYCLRWSLQSSYNCETNLDKHTWSKWNEFIFQENIEHNPSDYLTIFPAELEIYDPCQIELNTYPLQ